MEVFITLILALTAIAVTLGVSYLLGYYGASLFLYLTTKRKVQ